MFLVVTGNLVGMGYTDEQRRRISQIVSRVRIAKGLGKEEASDSAGVNSITWKRIEDAESVRDASLGKVLGSLGLDLDTVLHTDVEAQIPPTIPGDDAHPLGWSPMPTVPERTQPNDDDSQLSTTLPIAELLDYLRSVVGLVNSLDYAALSPAARAASKVIRASTGSVLMLVSVGAEPRAAMQYVETISNLVVQVFSDQPEAGTAMQSAVEAIHQKKAHVPESADLVIYYGTPGEEALGRIELKDPASQPELHRFLVEHPELAARAMRDAIQNIWSELPPDIAFSATNLTLKDAEPAPNSSPDDTEPRPADEFDRWARPGEVEYGREGA